MKRSIVTVMLLMAVLTSTGSLGGCDNEDKRDINKYYTLGQANPFKDNKTRTLVSESDKENVYYQNGSYYVVEDDVIKQTQVCEVVPRDITVLDYLKTYEDFSQEKATIKCTAMDGTTCSVDLSTKWEQCSFGELSVYWETDNSNGVLLTLYPDCLATVNKFLYYTDLTETVENVSADT